MGSNGKGSDRRCSECGAIAPGDDGLCKACRIGKEHGPEARQRYMSDLARKGGKAAHEGPRAVDVRQLPPLEGHAEVKVWIAYLAAGVASGRIDQDLSREVRQLLRVWMKAHKGEVTDEIVAELQEQVEELRRQIEGEREPWA